MSRLFTPGSAEPDPGARVSFLRWFCPVCNGGEDPWAGGCMHCHGIGLTNDVAGWPEEELREVPRPPGVMPSPCGDCAYRAGSPEEESGDAIPRDASRPFYCHTGIPVVDGVYTYPAMMADGRPVGALVCAGWWNSVLLGEQAPQRPYKDPPEVRAKNEARRVEGLPEGTEGQACRAADLW